MDKLTQRAGRYVQQTTGYKAFTPEPLPPTPDIAFDGELRTLLSQADRDIARLDAIAALLPNPDLFVAMYVRHEAVLSSQIEGTQSTLEDVLAFEAQGTSNDMPKDVEEVINYVRAMNHGKRLHHIGQRALPACWSKCLYTLPPFALSLSKGQRLRQAQLERRLAQPERGLT